MQKAKVAVVAMLALGGVLAASAQSTSSTTTTTKTTTTRKHKVMARKSGPTVEEQIRELREQTQTQIDSLKQQLADRDAKLQAAQDSAAAAASQASAAASQAQAAAASASSSTSAVNTLQGAVDDLKTTTATVQTEEKDLKHEVMEPERLHYKGITLTPGGFLAAETGYRQRGIGGDINTQFSAIPYSGISQGHLSEFDFSGRQSRISLLAEAKNNGWTYRGYYEADFLSAGVTSNSNESNSYTLRQRQVFAQAQNDNGFRFTGGQMWSLLAETKAGLNNRTEISPMTIDPQYTAGFVWSRQPGLRMVKSFAGDKFAIGVSAEMAETTNVTCHAPSSTPELCNSITYQLAGNTGGLFNNQANYSFNKLPDFVGKLAFDPSFGHFEVGGIISTFRDRYFPNAALCLTGTPAVYAPCAAGAVGATNLTTTGGGVEGSARFSVAHKADIGFKMLAGAGIERYGTSTLPEVIIKPTGALEPLRGGSALSTLELHPTKRLDLYANFGVDYVERTTYSLGGVEYGYGSPNQKTTGCQQELSGTAGGGAGGSGTTPTGAANCTADNRAIGELTGGYWYRFYKGPKGTLQQGMQFSYVERATWAGTGGSPKATDFLWFTSFRYYLPTPVDHKQ